MSKQFGPKVNSNVKSVRTPNDNDKEEVTSGMETFDIFISNVPVLTE